MAIAHVLKQTQEVDDKVIAVERKVIGMDERVNEAADGA
jgi:hypothetical protein